jgi:putative heme iron utilization protein
MSQGIVTQLKMSKWRIQKLWGSKESLLHTDNKALETTGALPWERLGTGWYKVHCTEAEETWLIHVNKHESLDHSE